MVEHVGELHALQLQVRRGAPVERLALVVVDVPVVCVVPLALAKAAVGAELQTRRHGHRVEHMESILHGLSVRLGIGHAAFDEVDTQETLVGVPEESVQGEQANFRELVLARTDGRRSAFHQMSDSLFHPILL